ncbi:glycosyltransferase [Desulfoscipio gibsoniae]|uniref:Glycosyltransferase n=1 Tax=Desulfoscipio gibsoniae DSM 7213 TaxID=767817 RepID=R4KQG8_9FIRM|nr:glycosyltransferase [Desulfoscipio gibsoniae]AGL03787.1 glycosyltransferase [Desulfoscipio gibsoniae DSM 7213]
MKLWFLTTEYPPFFGGGIGTYMKHAVQMFAGAGHEVTVFVHGQENQELRQTERVRVVRFRSGCDDLGQETAGPEPDDHPAYPFNIMSHWPALSYCYAMQVRRYMDREGLPDVIEVQDYGGLGYYLLQQKWLGYAGISQVPVLVHLHTPTFEILTLDQYPAYRLPEYWAGRMEKFSILAADALICPSNFLKDKVTQTITGGRENLDIKVIRLPFEQPQPLNTELTEQPPEQLNTLVYVGRMELRKGVVPMLAACDRLWQSGEQFKILMVGGDTDFYTRGMSVGDYLRQCYGHWVDAGFLHFTGNLPPEECARQVALARAVLVPSLYENFPLTCVEAMHAGKPVIASSAGGQAEMVGGAECGRIFDWSESGSLERSIKEILSMSTAEIQATGRRARAKIQSMTAYENVLPRRMEVFEALKKRAADKRIFPSVNQFDPWPVLRERGPVESGAEAGLLSVVIPFYNMGRYIDETLQSALNSTYRPLEIVIVNDGSNDQPSINKLREVEATGPAEVRVVHTENMGLASARNTGAAHARGEFLALLDADDLVEPDFYGRAIKILNQYDNVSLVYAWVRYFDAAHGCFIAYNLEFPFLLAHNMLAAICVLKKADFINFARNNPKMLYGLEDYESWISLYESGRLGVCIPEFLTSYRVRTDSMIRGMNDNQVLRMYDEITRLHAESYQRYGTELFSLLNTNGASYTWNSPGNNWQSAELRARHLEREIATLNDQLARIQYLAADAGYISDAGDIEDIGIKKSLHSLGKGLKRKSRQLFAKFANR